MVVCTGLPVAPVAPYEHAYTSRVRPSAVVFTGLPVALGVLYEHAYTLRMRPSAVVFTGLLVSLQARSETSQNEDIVDISNYCPSLSFSLRHPPDNPHNG